MTHLASSYKLMGMAALLLLLSVEWEVAPGDDEAQEEQATHDEGEGVQALLHLLLLRAPNPWFFQ